MGSRGPHGQQGTTWATEDHMGSRGPHGQQGTTWAAGDHMGSRGPHGQQGTTWAAGNHMGCRGSHGEVYWHLYSLIGRTILILIVHAGHATALMQVFCNGSPGRPARWKTA